MYIIVVYDIGEERVNKVCKFLKTWLYWIQNSVFEGEVTNANLEEIKVGLKKIIKKDDDSVIIFKIPSKKNMEKDILGKERMEITNIL